MKKLIMMMAMALSAAPLIADTETVGGITWNYTVSDGNATIYNGGSAAIPTSTTGAITIPSSLGGYPVTSIGESAFAGCSGLTNVTISSSVTIIGSWAFYGCSGLTSVTIPSSIGDYAFSGCSGLASVTISDGVTSIGESAFSGCSGLTSVTIPGSVTSVGSQAFYNCSAMTNFVFMGGAPTTRMWSFSNVASGCVASVSPKSTGWGVAVGEKWNGLVLQYWPEVLTEAANAAEVGAIMSTFADGSIAAEVATVAEYEDFKAWVDGKNLYQPAVVASPHAAAAYLLGAERLFENEPVVEFVEVAVGEGNVKNMTVAVTVKDGGRAVAVDAAKVAAMFEATSDIGDWNGDAKLVPTVTTTGVDANGKMSFTVTPGDGTSSRAFLRIKR